MLLAFIGFNFGLLCLSTQVPRRSLSAAQKLRGERRFERETGERETGERERERDGRETGETGEKEGGCGIPVAHDEW